LNLSSVTDECYFVPNDVDLEDVREAFASNDPQVRRYAREMRYGELGEVVHTLLVWFTDSNGSRLNADLLASVFGLAVRRSMTDAMLAERNHISLRAFQQENRKLLQVLGLRCVRLADVMPPAS
jgi:hypothetical protein